MAEQGGYRRPSKQQSFSGVGKNSRRTDKQIKRSPNVQDSTDLQVGDREKIRQGQQARGLPQTPSPSVSAPPRGGSPSPTAGAGAGLPDHLMSIPTGRPGEDEMTPATPAPIEPEDDQEVVLQWLVDTFQDDAANRMLQDKRAAKVTPMQPTTFTEDLDEPTLEPGEPEAIELGEDLATEGAAAGEDVDQTSVETPAAPSETPVV